MTQTYFTQDDLIKARYEGAMNFADVLESKLQRTPNKTATARSILNTTRMTLRMDGELNGMYPEKNGVRLPDIASAMLLVFFIGIIFYLLPNAIDKTLEAQEQSNYEHLHQSELADFERDE